jgi:hypothetical protein
LSNSLTSISISGNGTVNLNGSAAQTLSVLSMTAGALNNAGVLNIGSLNVNLPDAGAATLGGIGAINLTGVGGLTKTTGYYNSPVLTIDGGKVLTNLLGASFTETGYGPLTNSAGSVVTLALANGSSIVNAGNWTLSNGQVNAGATTTVVGFSNTGTLVTGAGPNVWGTGTGGSINVGLSNSGTVNAAVGTLTLNGTGSYTHTGVFNTAAGAAISFTAGTHTLSNATAAITGAGAVNFTGSAASTITGAVSSTGNLSNSGAAVTTLSGAAMLAALSLTGGTFNLNSAGPTSAAGR